MVAFTDGTVDSPADRRRQQHQYDLVPLSDRSQNPVSVFLTDEMIDELSRYARISHIAA
ncbi:hypothetical protein [Amycolatopsis orientalis]|uniref:hypothetical protein n=1 Tax=Amycolatopsis orientalis TaxID=31958 RepID=UPI000AE7033B|nr:hypothetical protein [Amycolatopsis orientalis]